MKWSFDFGRGPMSAPQITIRQISNTCLKALKAIAKYSSGVMMKERKNQSTKSVASHMVVRRISRLVYIIASDSCKLTRTTLSGLLEELHSGSQRTVNMRQVPGARHLHYLTRLDLKFAFPWGSLSHSSEPSIIWTMATRPLPFDVNNTLGAAFIGMALVCM